MRNVSETRQEAQACNVSFRQGENDQVRMSLNAQDQRAEIDICVICLYIKNKTHSCEKKPHCKPGDRQ